MRDYEHGIEVARKAPNFPVSMAAVITFGTSNLTRLAYQADFILDLTTFKVVKHRYGDYMMTPKQAHDWLTYYLTQPNMRILLLTD